MTKLFLSLGIALCCSGLATAQQETLPTPASAEATFQTFHSGWAGLEGDKLAGRVVTLNEDGSDQAVAMAAVQLLRNGQVIAETQSDEAGNFELTGVKPGVYAIRARGENSYASFALHALPAEARVPAGTNVYAASMQPSEVERVLKTLWAPPREAPQRPSFQDIGAKPYQAVQTPVVRMRDGVVHGQVAFDTPYVIPQAHIVQVFRGDELIATSAVDSMGRYSFEPGQPGVYNIILGGNAHSAFGVRIVDSDANEVSGKMENARFVSSNSAAVQADVLLIPAATQAPVQDPPPGDDGDDSAGVLPPAPMAGGFGGGGGGFGGGGAGGGGGGFGALLGLGGLAGLAGLAGSDDGFDGVPATPIE